jgi:hypothetical protein
MERFEHCMVEFYWSHPSGVAPARFKPAFTVFHPDGRTELKEGGNPEITALFNQMGTKGWRVSSAVTASNWILWTLERKIS